MGEGVSYDLYHLLNSCFKVPNGTLTESEVKGESYKWGCQGLESPGGCYGGAPKIVAFIVCPLMI